MIDQNSMAEYFQKLADDAAARGGLSGKGAYFRPGVYDLTLRRAFTKHSSQRGTSSVFEFRVDKATRTSEAEEPNAAGSTVSQVLKPNENSNFGLVSKDNLLKIGAAFANVSEEDFMDKEKRLKVAKMLEALFHPTNPCRGMAIRAEAFTSENKAGDDRTYVKFTHDPAALNAEEHAKRRAAIDAGG